MCAGAAITNLQNLAELRVSYATNVGNAELVCRPKAVLLVRIRG